MYGQNGAMHKAFIYVDVEGKNIIRLAVLKLFFDLET